MLALLHTCHGVFFFTLEAGGKRTVINGATRASPLLFHHGVIIVLLVCHGNLSASPGTSAAPFVKPEEREGILAARLRSGSPRRPGFPYSRLGWLIYISHKKLSEILALACAAGGKMYGKHT